MDQNRKRNRIAWVALAVGVLAIGLFVGRMHGAAQSRWGMMGHQQTRPGWQQGPDWQQGPKQGWVPQGPPPLREQGRPGMPMGPGMMRPGFGPHMGGMRGESGGPLLGLLNLIGGVLKVAVWGMALFLLVTVWRDRQRGKGTPAHGATQPAAGTNPEEPPYTGMTTNL